MVTLQILVLSFLVRVRVPQLFERLSYKKVRQPFFFISSSFSLYHQTYCFITMSPPVLCCQEPVPFFRIPDLTRCRPLSFPKTSFHSHIHHQEIPVQPFLQIQSATRTVIPPLPSRHTSTLPPAGSRHNAATKLLDIRLYLPLIHNYHHNRLSMPANDRLKP